MNLHETMNLHLLLELFKAKVKILCCVAVKIVVLLIFMENNISNFQFFNSFKNWL